MNATFFAEYNFPNNEPHIFTPIHQWVQTQRERLFAETKQQSKESDVNDAITTTDDTKAAASAAPSSSKPNNNHNDNISELLRIAKGHR